MTAGNSRTPFLDFQSFVAEQSEVMIQPQRAAAARSPFVSIYEFAEGEGSADDPTRESYAEIVNELYDEEFDEALFELMTDARALHQSHVSSGASHADAERLLTQHFTQLNHESEAMIDAMARQLGARDQSGLSESEVDSFLDGFTPSTTLEPAFENFFGKLVKKIGGAVKKVASVAAKLGLGPILNKIKALVKPLLNKVLQKAIGKLPEAIQPAARKLAEKLGFAKPAENAGGAQGADAATPPPEAAGTPVQDPAGANVTEMQQEFDQLIAEALLADDEVELNLEVARLRAHPSAPAIPVYSNLDDAREQFVRELDELREGEDPQPHIQNFLPAVLPALKIGIRLIGRPKVVNFLAQFLSKLVAKLIGPAQAPALSRAIVDSGLKLLSLEMSESEKSGLAASAVAATVEETAIRVASLPDHVLDNQELLEGFVLEAFEQAAAANLPAIFPESVYRQRPDLLEGGVNAGWVMLPMRGPKRYKRCSRTFQVKITPQMAEEIESFEGAPLSDFLQDQLGIPEGTEVEAEVHLYEALPGTTIADITRAETTAGLGASDEASMSQIHPLTREAAGTLLGRPGLGRTLPDTADNRKTTAAGQRLFHLAIAGKRPLTVPGVKGGRQVRRLVRVRVMLNPSTDTAKVNIFLSEVKAQKLAVRMRQQSHAGALTVSFSKLMARRLPPILRGRRPRALKVVHAGVAPGPALSAAFQKAPPAILEALNAKLQELLVQGFSDFVKANAQRFLSAVDEPADGVTLAFTVENLPGLKDLGQSLSGKPAANGPSTAGTPNVKVEVFAGWKSV